MHVVAFGATAASHERPCRDRIAHCRGSNCRGHRRPKSRSLRQTVRGAGACARIARRCFSYHGRHAAWGGQFQCGCGQPRDLGHCRRHWLSWCWCHSSRRWPPARLSRGHRSIDLGDRCDRHRLRSRCLANGPVGRSRCGGHTCHWQQDRPSSTRTSWAGRKRRNVTAWMSVRTTAASMSATGRELTAASIRRRLPPRADEKSS